jgi:hypothetical protein
MGFLTPLAFALALLLPIIVAMYLLKLRRMEREVSSVYLWRRMVRDVEANAPWQRLRRNLLLLLQLLFLAAMILALARPFRWVAGAGGQAAILIIDHSASMAATDTAPNRLEAAKAQARRLVDELPEGRRVTVIAAAGQAQVMAASTQDRRQAHQAIESIELSTGSSDLSVALELASAIAARQPETEIVVLSDGRVTLPERLALKGTLRYLPIGTRGENQAISLFTLEAAPGGESLTAFAQVTNYAAAPVQRRLGLYAGSVLLNAFDVSLPAGGQQAVLAEGLPPDIGLVEARLEETLAAAETQLEATTQPPPSPAAATAAVGDFLPTDDRALAVYRAAPTNPVRLVTSGNRFLQTALSLLPGFEVTIQEPETFETGGTPEGEGEETENDGTPGDLSEGLTIFDNYVPITSTLPSGSLLFIAPPSSTGYFTVTGQLAAPTLRSADPPDPLLENVVLDDISVLDASRIPLPGWAKAVIWGDVQSDTAPLLFTGEQDARRVAVLAFDLRHSDLPLNIAFPLLWANLMSWLAPESGGQVPPQIAPGQALSFSLPPEIESVTLTRPDGAVQRIRSDGGQVVVADTGDLGIYTLSWGDANTASFAVNLFSPQESEILPQGTLTLPGAAGGSEGQADLQARREWWRLPALLALALLTAEWMVYQRSGLARLRSRLWSKGKSNL